MQTLKAGLAIAASLIAIVNVATAQKKAEPSDAQYTAKALSAAPASIAKDATVVRMDTAGKMKTLREGKNGYTCMIAAGNKMCADANSMEFFGAWMNHQTPPDKLGLTYMLAGDDGASNTDPNATGKSADNHWVVTGPRIMGRARKQVIGIDRGSRRRSNQALHDVGWHALRARYDPGCGSEAEGKASDHGKTGDEITLQVGSRETFAVPLHWAGSHGIPKTSRVAPVQVTSFAAFGAMRCCLDEDLDSRISSRSCLSLVAFSGSIPGFRSVFSKK